MNARLYDNVTARFMAPDPIVQAPSWTQSWNRFSYAWNSPMNWVDPSGLQNASVAGIENTPDGGQTISFTDDSLTGHPPDVTTTEPGYTLGDFYPASHPADIPPSAPAPLTAPLGPSSMTETPEGQLIERILEDALSDPACELASCYPEPTELMRLAQKQQADYEQLLHHRARIEADAIVSEGLGPGEFVLPAAGVARAAARGPATIDTALVRFSQNSVRGAFRNGTTLNEAAAALRAGGQKAAAAYPPIRVFERNGVLHTLDNRRLLVFSQAGMQVPFRMATGGEIAREFTGKFTTTAAQGWGQFITVRP